VTVHGAYRGWVAPGQASAGDFGRLRQSAQYISGIFGHRGPSQKN